MKTFELIRHTGDLQNYNNSCITQTYSKLIKQDHNNDIIVGTSGEKQDVYI